MKRTSLVVSTALIAGLLTAGPGALIAAGPAAAANCPPASVGGKTIGYIKVGTTKVPLKFVTYGKGQPLNPPATNQAAGVSLRSMPIGYKRGNSVITWHVRYGQGCDGTLNPILTKPIGTTFTVSGVGKKPKSITYKIIRKEKVPKGKHKKSWFKLTGPHRLVLLTCADYAGGSTFTSTQAIFAAPVTTTSKR